MAKKILFIEDDFQVGKMYKIALEERGYQVDLEPNPREAIEKLKNQPDYDLILLDLILPEKNGLDILEQIKQEGSPAKHIPVYILTNVDKQDSIGKGVSLGAEGYFIKITILPNQMADEIDHFFASRQENIESKDNPSI